MTLSQRGLNDYDGRLQAIENTLRILVNRRSEQDERDSAVSDVARSSTSGAAFNQTDLNQHVAVLTTMLSRQPMKTPRMVLPPLTTLTTPRAGSMARLPT